MADDDVRPGFEPQPPKEPRHAPGAPDAPAPGEDDAVVTPPPVEETTEPDVTAAAEAEAASGEGETAPVEAPSMASAGADFAAPERPAESFAPAFTPPESPSQSRPIMPVLLATIGLVLVVLLGINLYLMVNPPGSDGMAALQTQAGALERRVDALEHRPAADPAMDARLKTLDGRVAQLSGALDDLRGKLGAAPDAAAAATAADTALGGRITALDARAGDLDHALADLRQQVASLPKPDFGPIESKVADLSTGLAAVKADLAALPKIDLTPLDQKIAAIDHRLAPIETEFSAPKIAANVSEARQQGSAAETRAAPVAVTAQAILQAIDDGHGFAPEFAALQTLGADPTQLAALQPVAAKGAPTKASLVAGFTEARNTATIAAAPVQTGTVLDRMMASATSMVKVRAAGASPGGDTDAIFSRIDADLTGGDFRAALVEWNALPEAARTASAAWGAQLKTRVLAETAARSIAAGAIAALSPTP